jgi:hypothetical protein
MVEPATGDAPLERLVRAIRERDRPLALRILAASPCPPGLDFNIANSDIRA